MGVGGAADMPPWLMMEIGYFGGQSWANPSLPHQDHKDPFCGNSCS